MNSLSLDEKTTILAFRGVIFLLLCFFLLYNPRIEAVFSLKPFAWVGVYLLSNLALLPIDKSKFRSSLLSIAIFLFDTASVSWIIYCSEGFSSDLYLVYFLVVFMSGIQMKIWQSFLIGSVASVLYVAIWSYARPNEDFLSTHVLLRLPFFYLVSFFTAYFAQQVRERETRIETQYKRELAKAERRAITGQLAGKIAFEMNNPLGVVIGFAQSILRRVGSGDPLYLAAKHMFESANRCREMVENLLLLSEETWATMDAVDMNVVVRDVVAQLNEDGVLPRKNVLLQQNLEVGIPLIRGERRQLGRAIHELVRNALDAMPDGGTLTIENKLMRMRDGAEIKCEVKDTGSGIDGTVGSKIFEPFFTTKPGEGKGLGLSYVSAIAQRHHGTVEFHARVGRGTSFILRLPTAGVNGRAPLDSRERPQGAIA